MGVSGSLYSFDRLLDHKCKKIIFVGQNLRTLMGATGFKDRILDQLKAGAEVWFIGSTYEGMKAISRECADHFDQTLKDFKELYDTVGIASKLFVRFHPSAISLSCLIRDPDHEKRGIVVMTPKWARDADPGNRLYCVVEKWEYRDLFNRVTGHFTAMTQTDSQKLKDISNIVKKEIEAGSKNDNQNVKPVLEYFITSTLP